MNQGRSLDTAKKEKEKKEIAEITVIILHTQVMLSFAEQLTKKKNFINGKCQLRLRNTQ